MSMLTAIEQTITDELYTDSWSRSWKALDIFNPYVGGAYQPYDWRNEYTVVAGFLV